MREIEAKKLVSDWNRQNPPGTHVFFFTETGRKIFAKTREAAAVFSNMALVRLEGIAGLYPVNRLTPLDPDEILARQAAGEAVPS